MTSRHQHPAPPRCHRAQLVGHRVEPGDGQRGIDRVAAGVEQRVR